MTFSAQQYTFSNGKTKLGKLIKPKSQKYCKLPFFPSHPCPPTTLLQIFSLQRKREVPGKIFRSAVGLTVAQCLK